MEKKILEFYEEFFKKIQIHISNITIEKRNNSSFLIHIHTSDDDLISDEKGKRLEPLQRITQMCVNNFTEEKVHIKLKINDSLISKDDSLYSFIDEKVRILLENGGEYMLPLYGPYERKKIHSYIAHIKKGIKTKSRGVGNDRRLYLMLQNTQKPEVMKPHNQNRKSKLTIDIDGDNI
ncbi:hypothetical protein LR004_01030 [Candidatus Gracilibacteria bacterium]|nr:hypothetical protein [Candidatus Gracilibacteria bacterium]